MKTFFGFLYHLVGLMAGAGGLMAFVVGLIVAWDKNHYLAVSIFFSSRHLGVSCHYLF